MSTDSDRRFARFTTGHWPALALWTAVWLLFFAPLLAGVAHIANGDFSGQFHAFGLFQAREMAAGRLPLWSPGSFGGFPFAADPQSAAFYPLRWLTILLSLPWDFPYYALQLEASLHIWLAGAFAYCLAYDITRRRATGLLAAFAFGLGGYLTSYPLLQLAILESITWLPAILFLLRRALLNGPARPLAAAAGVALGLSVLAGHPQTALHVVYVAAVYYLFLAWRARRPIWATVKLGALLGVIALGVSAAAWLPAVRYTAETMRANVDYAFVSSGFPLLDYLQLVAPGVRSLWSPQYIGLAAALFAALALFQRDRVTAADPTPDGGVSRSEIAFWGAVALITLCLSLGDNGILFELAYHVAPGFALFRQQERLAGVFSLAMALLAAQGLAIWLSRPRPSRVAEGRAVLLVGGLWLLAGITLAAMRDQANAEWRLILLRQAALFIPLVVVFAGQRRGRPAVALILGLLIADLFLAVRPGLSLTGGSPSVFWPRPAWLEPLLADSTSRLDSQNLFHANVGEIYGLQDIRGISPLKPAVVERYESLPRPLRWQLLNVTHVLAPEAIEPGLTPVADIEESIIPGEHLDATVYRYEDALPRAWLSHEPIIAADTDTALALMLAPEFDPARQVVLTPAAEAHAATVSPLAGATRVTTALHPRGLDLSVTTTTPAFLVISEFARDGWRATLDGESLPLLEANAGLMALPVPAGAHTIALRFQPWDVPVGAAISLLTVLVAIVLAAFRPRAFVWPERTPRRPSAETPVTTYTRHRAARRPGLPVLLVLLLLAFGLRVHLLGNQELRGDEAFNYGFAQLQPAEVIPELISQGDPHSPLPYLALNVWTRLAGISEFSLRYLSAVAGVLLVATLYALGRRMAGRPAGVLAAALAAVSPGLIWLAQDTRTQYALVMLFASLATLILVTPTRKPAVYWGLYLLACVLTVYSHYYGAFALASHGLYLWFAPGRRRDVWPWLAIGIVTAGVLGIWLVATAGSVFGAGHLADPARPELARHITAIGRDLIIGQSLAERLARWLFLGGAALAGGGAVALVRAGRRAWAAMLVSWILLAVYVFFLVRFSRGTFNNYYGSVVAPAWWLLIGAALAALWQGNIRRRIVAALAVIVLAAAVLVALRHYYYDPLYSRTLGYRQVAAHLAQAAGPNDLLIVPYPDPGWNYYLRDSAVPRRMLPTPGATAAETQETLAQWAADYERLWFIPYSGWDTENIVGQWLDYNTLTEERTAQGRMELRAYRPLAATEAVMGPVGRSLGDELSLAGAYVTVDGQAVDLSEAVAATPESTIAVTLLWEALEPADRSYTVFVHLRDANGALIAQHDGIPILGTRPTPTWQPGEQLLDRHELIVPEGASGPATLVVGLYDSETIVNQTFDNGETALWLADFVIQP